MPGLFACVPGMFDSLEVKVLCPSGWRRRASEAQGRRREAGSEGSVEQKTAARWTRTGYEADPAGRAGTKLRSPGPSRAGVVDPAGVRRRRSSLPREISSCSASDAVGLLLARMELPEAGAHHKPRNRPHRRAACAKAVRYLTGDERIRAVIGLAGAGKSTLLAAARRAWEADRYTVHGERWPAKRPRNWSGHRASRPARWRPGSWPGRRTATELATRPGPIREHDLRQVHALVTGLAPIWSPATTIPARAISPARPARVPLRSKDRR